MSVESLEKLFVNELKDLYSAEKQMLKALPRLAKAATNPELKKAFQNHQNETEQQVKRIEKIFSTLEGSPNGKKCHGMEGLVKEGKEVLEEDMPNDLRDAALIGAAQRVEHYEMAAYGTVREFAKRLGMKDAVKLIQETLDEEGNADKLLTAISQRVNAQAEAAD